MVYSRQPRHRHQVCDEQGCVEEAANWQHRRDVARVVQFSESDIVLDDLSGNTKVLLNCTESEEICAGLEAKVSPDGRRIAFIKAKGNRKIPVKVPSGPMTDLWDFDVVTAEIWIHDLTTGKSWRETAGHTDMGVDWINNETLVFDSDRAGTRAPLGYAGDYYTFPAHQIYRMTVGKPESVELLTPQEAFAMNPRVFTNGDICYSSWQGFYPRGVGLSPRNLWWGMCVDQYGGGTVEALYGAHGSPIIEVAALISDWVDPARRGEGATTIRAPRPPSEIFSDYFTFPNYYRGNSGGPFGTITGCHRREQGEGFWKSINIRGAVYKRDTPGSGRFFPDCDLLTPFGQDQDLMWPRMHKDGRAAGRASFAEPDPWGDFYIYTHARGFCFEAAMKERANREAMGGEPTCKLEIRRALQLVVKNPFDPKQSVCIAGCEDRWNVWDAQTISTYQERFGQPMPDQHKPYPPGECELRIVDARDSELLPFPNATDRDKVTYQGNSRDGHSQNLEYITIHTIKHWTGPPARKGFMEKAPHSRTKVLADGSAKIPVPCETPFLMTGEDAAGEVIATDNTPLSLAKGEVRTCHGCHARHSYEGLAEIGGRNAEERFKETKAGGGQ